MEKANISLYQKVDYSNKKGEYPIYIRTIINRKASYYKTGFSVTKDEWDKVNKKVKLHKDKSHINSILQKKLSEFETAYLTAVLTDTPFSGKNKKVDFHEYWEAKIKQMERSKGKEKAKFKRSTLTKFQTFKPSLYFGHITPKLMKQYEQWLEDRGNESNTIWAAIKDVRSIISLALKEGVIKTNPLHGYNPPKFENPQRDYLTEEQVNKLEDYAKDESNHKTLRNAVNWFLFGVYSGLRYSDMVQFKLSKIVNDRIILRTEKTKEDVTIKVHPKLKEVINRLSERVYSNYRQNIYLKTVAKELKIKRFTMHQARHTAAVLFLTKGGSMEALSKLLGHSSIRTTEIYGKVSNQKLDAEIDKVWS